MDEPRDQQEPGRDSQRSSREMRIEVALPPGLDTRQARELCVQALAAAMERARGGLER